MSGASYECNDATIKTKVTLPGGDIPYVGTENCTFNAIHLSPEIKAIRSDIDEKLGPEIKLLRNFIIAVLALLTVAAVLSGFYVWRQSRR